MKSIGIVRRIDALGRVVLPIELRETMGIQPDEALEIFEDDLNERIIYRKYQIQVCVFCRSEEGLIFWKNKFLCSNCLREIQDIEPSSEGEEPIPSSDEFMTTHRRIRTPKKKKERSDLLNKLLELKAIYPHYTQVQLAKMLGITQSRVSQMLKNK